jgi:hypothetical protein
MFANGKWDRFDSGAWEEKIDFCICTQPRKAAQSGDFRGVIGEHDVKDILS